MDERERAALWRTQQRRRRAYKRAANRRLSGDAAEAQRIREAWEAVKKWHAPQS